jgi:SAM-dependent methyltransferase
VNNPSWYLDEVEHAGFEHLDTDYVATYDQKAGEDVTLDVSTLRDLGLDRTKTLVDLGAGTGALALKIAPLCRRVIAVDVSSAMIASLRAKIERARIGNVECAHAGFLSYEHHGDPADFVYSRNALHHLPDFWKVLALRRIAAMLEPGGILRLRDLVYSFDPGEVDRVLEAWFAGGRETPEDGWTRAELEVHVRTEYSTFNWILEPMLERAGFTISDAEYSRSQTYAAYVCARK